MYEKNIQSKIHQNEVKHFTLISIKLWMRLNMSSFRKLRDNQNQSEAENDTMERSINSPFS